MRISGLLVVVTGVLMWLFLASSLADGTEDAGATPGAGIVPTPAATETSNVSATGTPEAADEPIPDTYTVVPGDTLARIASRFRVPLDRLMEVNGITDPGSLQAGQTLTIPREDE